MDTQNADSRREFIKKGAYIVPAVLTLNVALVEARAGSSDPSGIAPKTRDSERATDIRYERDVTR